MQLDLRFWSEEETKLYGTTASIIMGVYQAGGLLGQAMLPNSLQDLVNWDVFNQAAIDYLKLFRLDQVRGITETTRDKAIQIIDEWVQSGAPLQNLINSLGSPLLLGAFRAEMIAITEVTRAYALGNLTAWKSTGWITEKVWMTAEDERVCPYCGSMAGKVVEIDSTFEIPLDELPEELKRNKVQADFARFSPPFHPRCRCWLKPVVSELAFERKINEILSR